MVGTRRTSPIPRGERGAVITIFVAVMFFALLMLALIFDYSRVYVTNELLQSAVDRGLLAITQRKRTVEHIPASEAESIFGPVAHGNIMLARSPYIVPGSLKMALSEVPGALPAEFRATASASVATVFLGLIGISTLDVSASGKVALGDKGNPLILHVIVERMENEKPGDINMDGAVDDREMLSHSAQVDDFLDGSTLSACITDPKSCKNYGGLLKYHGADVSGGEGRHPDGRFNHHDAGWFLRERDPLAGGAFEEYGDALMTDRDDESRLRDGLRDGILGSLRSGDYIALRSANHYWKDGWGCRYDDGDYDDATLEGSGGASDVTAGIPGATRPLRFGTDGDPIPDYEIDPMSLYESINTVNPKRGCARGSHLQGAIRFARESIKSLSVPLEEGGSPMIPESEMGRYKKAIVIISRGAYSAFAKQDASPIYPPKGGGSPNIVGGGESLPPPITSALPKAPTCSGAGRRAAGLAMAIREADAARAEGIGVYAICIDCDSGCTSHDLRFDCSDAGRDRRRQRLMRLSFDPSWNGLSAPSVAGAPGGPIKGGGGSNFTPPEPYYFTTDSEANALSDDPEGCRAYYSDPYLNTAPPKGNRFFETGPGFQGLGDTLGTAIKNLRKGGLAPREEHAD